MTDVNLNIGWKPYPWQVKALDVWRSVLYLVLTCARQMGKTTLLLGILLEGSTRQPNQLFWYCSPALNLAREQYEKMKRMLLSSGLFVFHDTYRQITCPNGTRFVFVSYEQGNNLRGDPCDGIIIDEFGSMAGWFIRDVLEPKVAHTGGWIVYCGTSPDPLESPDPLFFEQMVKFAEKTTDKDWGYCCFNYEAVAKVEPTYRKFVARQKRIHGEDSLHFKREFLCQIVRPEEISLPFENLRWYDERESLPLHMTVVITVDPSFSDNEAADPRAIVTTGLDDLGDLYVLRAEQGRWGYEEFIGRVYRAYEETTAFGWECQSIGIEKAGVGAPFIKALQREANQRRIYLPIKEIPNYGSTLSRILSIEPWLQQKRIVLHTGSAGCRELAEQAELFPRGLINDTSKIRHKSGIDHHYDVLNALAFRTVNFYPPLRPREIVESGPQPGETWFRDEIRQLKRRPVASLTFHTG